MRYDEGTELFYFQRSAQFDGRLWVYLKKSEEMAKHGGPSERTRLFDGMVIAFGDSETRVEL